MTTPNDQLMTPRQVAKLLQISERTLWTWHRNGRLPAVKIGPDGRNGSVRYRPADVARFIEERSTAGSA
jgi:excisionase family DNA binding protein